MIGGFCTGLDISAFPLEPSVDLLERGGLAAGLGDGFSGTTGLLPISRSHSGVCGAGDE